MRHRLAAGALALTTATSTIVTGSSAAAAAPEVAAHAVPHSAPTVTGLGYVLDDYRRQLRLAAAEALRLAHMSAAQRQAHARAHHRAAVAAARAWKTQMRAHAHARAVEAARIAARKAALYTPSYVWAHRPFSIRVANCESGGGPTDRSLVYNGNPYLNDPNGHHGKWQFDYGTWREVGGSGNPANHSVAEQDSRAYALWRANGWGRWSCAHMVG